MSSLRSCLHIDFFALSFSMSAVNTRKRKQPQRARRAQPVPQDREVPPPDPTLFIQAHEADIVRGPQAYAMALSLEATAYEDKGKLRVKVGDGLIPWHGSANQSSRGFEGDGEEVVSLGQTHIQIKQPHEDEDPMWVDRYASSKTHWPETAHGYLIIWVLFCNGLFPPSHPLTSYCRYDARLLLDSLPTVFRDEPADDPSSPGGWSDLPSDAEDTFFFSPDETDDYRREKRRRLIDQGREARLRALQAEEGEDAQEQWGGSDEEVRRAPSRISHVLNSLRSLMSLNESSCAARRITSSARPTPPSWRCASSRTMAQTAALRFSRAAGRAHGGLQRPTLSQSVQRLPKKRPAWEGSQATIASRLGAMYPWRRRHKLRVLPL